MDDVIKAVEELIAKHRVADDGWEDSALWYGHLQRLQTILGVLQGMRDGWDWRSWAWTSEPVGSDDWMELFRQHGLPKQMQ